MNLSFQSPKDTNNNRGIRSQCHSLRKLFNLENSCIIK